MLAPAAAAPGSAPVRLRAVPAVCLGRSSASVCWLAAMSPLKGRAALPIDIANAALYLASDEAGMINGQCLTIDGGLTTGSTANDPPYSSPKPFMREAGKTGLS